MTLSLSAAVLAVGHWRAIWRRRVRASLILERGDWLKREQQNWDAEEVFIKNRYVPKETWYDKTGKPFQPGLHYFVGGATKMLRRGPLPPA